jgi:phosphonopyruvate decarboxylase
MIKAKELNIFLTQLGLKYFTGVPDSLMSRLCWELVEQSKLESSEIKTEIVANEGIAVANSIGYFLATGRPGVVFLQNAGLGNIYNPFVSLCSEGVFNIPIIFLIGWRGDPNVKDEPQHIFQGQITNKTLEILNLPTLELNPDHNIDYLVDSNFIQRSVVNKKSCAILFATGAI